MRDLDLLIDAARKAGDVADAYFHGKNDVRYKPDDAGPVSDADIAVDRLLSDQLQAARPDYGWLSEETEDSAARLSTERQFIVDPIDGTRSFVDGSNTWAHSLAVVDNGRVTAAVVYLPLRDLLYAAEIGHGATLNGQAIQATTRPSLQGASVLAARPAFREDIWPGGLPQVERAYRPSLAYRLCLVAEGRFDAMLTLRGSWEWDIAAGALILSEAGATVTDQRGRPLRFNNPHPQNDGVIAAGAAVHRGLLAGLGMGV